MILFTTVQKYTPTNNNNHHHKKRLYIKVQQVKASNREKLNSHIKKALQNQKIIQLKIEYLIYNYRLCEKKRRNKRNYLNNKEKTENPNIVRNNKIIMTNQKDN